MIQILNSDKRLKIKTYCRKILIPIIILVIFLISSGYYFMHYYQARDLIFTSEDKFIFGFCIFLLILFIVSFIYNQIDKSKLLKIIFNLEEQITDAEDNCILVNRDTQEMICKYLKKEEKIETKQSIEQK